MIGSKNGGKTSDPRSETTEAREGKIVALPAGGDGVVPTTGARPAADKLTAEEQMALFEKALKEDDWGHQPC